MRTHFAHFLAIRVLYLALAICVALPYKVQHWTTPGHWSALEYLTSVLSPHSQTSADACRLIPADADAKSADADAKMFASAHLWCRGYGLRLGQKLFGLVYFALLNTPTTTLIPLLSSVRILLNMIITDKFHFHWHNIWHLTHVNTNEHRTIIKNYKL